MPLVHMIDLWTDAEGVEGTYAADAENNFLPNPHFQIAAVQLFGNQAILGRVLLDICIEQVKLNSADLELPNLYRDGSAENLDRDKKCSVFDFDIPDRQMVKILTETHRLLPAVSVDLLFEIADPVKQCH